jgi:hypothetical protein
MLVALTSLLKTCNLLRCISCSRNVPVQHTNYYLRPHQKGTNEHVKRQILIVERVQIPLVFTFAFVRERKRVGGRFQRR